jgi:hypothetical protein
VYDEPVIAVATGPRRRSRGGPSTRTVVAFVLASTVAAALGGCTLRLADLTVVSTRSLPLDRKDLDGLPRTPGVRGEDTAFWFVVPLEEFGIGVPHLGDAVDEALQKGGGDVMTDAVVHYSSYWLVLFGWSSISVEGDVVRTQAP